MTLNFQDKTILITGATRGLGIHIAQRFWHAGANLILVARNTNKLLALRTELLSMAQATHVMQTIETIPVDLACLESLRSLTQQIKHVDVLVNNAAIQGPIGPVWENDWEKWQATLQVNLLSPVALCRAVLPSMMKNRYGKIINLSGGGATQARPKFSAYASAKSGLVRFSETLAEEVKTFNIDVNCIAPGVMNTEMLNEIVRAGAEKTGDKEFSDACKHAGTDSSALDRAAELCVFLASSQSDGVTGKLISAVWDPWKELPSYIHDIKNSDIYTLRRILPKDRGKKWGDL